MLLDLRHILSLEPPDTWEVERFIGERLFDAGVWEDPGVSDGISYVRVVEHEPERVRLGGLIWEITDQTVHPFWLDLERSDDRVAWALHYDIVASSPRRARDAIHVIDRAGETEWRVTLAGSAAVRDGALVADPS